MRSVILSLAVLFSVASPSVATADVGSAVQVEPFTPPTGSAAGSAAVTVEPVIVPDPVADPVESASLLWDLYKAGHLVPALFLLAFFGLKIAQKKVAWLAVGYRKLLVASVLAGLAMIAERAANGGTPNLPMLMGAIGAALTLYMRGEGAPSEAKA